MTTQLGRRFQLRREGFNPGDADEIAGFEEPDLTPPPAYDDAVAKLGRATDATEDPPASDPAEWASMPAPAPIVRAPRSPPVDEELRRAQDVDYDDANSNRLSDLMVQAFSRGRIKPGARTGTGAVGELSQRRTADASALKARQQAELADPNSDVSKRVRGRFKGLEIGQKFSTRLGADYDRLPGSDLPAIDELLKAELRQANDDPSKIAYRNAQVAELGRKSEEATRQRSIDQQTVQAWRERFKDKPDFLAVLDKANGLDDRHLHDLVGSLEKQVGFGRDMFKQNDQQEFAGGENDENRSAAIAKENREQGRQYMGREVPGYQQNGSVIPDEVAVRDFRNAKIGTDILQKGIGSLAAMVQKYGITGVPGEAKADLESQLALLQLESKGKALFELGVLAGPDVDFLTKVTGDPTAWKSYLGGPQAILKRLSNMLSYAKTRLDSRAKNTGYDAVSTKTPGSAPRAAAAAPGGKITVTNGKETLQIDAADLKDAEAEGYRRAT